VASFQRASFLQSGIFGQYRGRGGGGRGYFRGKFLGRMIPRAPLICYSCGAASHIARNCQQQPKVGYLIQNDHGPIHANSAEFFDAALSEYWDGYDYGPWYLDSGASGQ
jgi:hypothetical protein